MKEDMKRAKEGARWVSGGLGPGREDSEDPEWGGGGSVPLRDSEKAAGRSEV